MYLYSGSTKMTLSASGPLLYRRMEDAEAVDELSEIPTAGDVKNAEPSACAFDAAEDNPKADTIDFDVLSADDNPDADPADEILLFEAAVAELRPNETAIAADIFLPDADAIEVTDMTPAAAAVFFPAPWTVEEPAEVPFADNVTDADLLIDPIDTDCVRLSSLMKKVPCGPETVYCLAIMKALTEDQYRMYSTLWQLYELRK